MRIISGSLKGRQFKAPPGHRTHPMSEKVRGGLFNALGDISGLVILDAFTGSGALAIESVSKGAKSVVAIDIDQKAINTTRSNVDELGLGSQIKVIRANASSWSDNNPSLYFDVVFSAPPYDDIKPALLNKLTGHLKPDGLYVLDWPGNQDIPVLIGLKEIKNKSYGDAQLVFYRKIT